MEYLEHLETDSFESPVKIRIGKKKNKEPHITPGISIENLFKETGLEFGETYDVAISTEGEHRKEFAFDAEHVDNPNQLVEDIHNIVDEFNELPDRNLGYKSREELEEDWEKHKAAVLDVSGLE